MTENMKHWDALKTTDPKYTKLVTFGRKFTSINSQWQLQRMTETFGPVGQGWGYEVKHSTEHLHPMYILAVADVTIWWKPDYDMARCEYGPVRGTAPVLEPARDKGRILMEADGETVKMHLDDDAGKKAMTDALTKGLSHLGLSADVFLGLFDDNKYVRQVGEQFANGNIGATPPPAPQPPSALDRVDEADRHLVQGDGRSAYQIAAADKPPGRVQAELLASLALGVLQTPGMDLVTYNAWKAEKATNKGTKTYGDRLEELREKHDDLARKIDEAVDLLRVAA